MALVLGKQVWVESELAHPTHESALIGAIPRSPAGHSALVVQLVERLPERQQRVGGRGEAELPVRLEPPDRSTSGLSAFIGGQMCFFPRSNANAKTPYWPPMNADQLYSRLYPGTSVRLGG